ncbi:MAG TPA: hypothetical protein VFT42_02950, partial [Solirubrobacteraceae bacterium]|nr:hypothetical protein [Solirubrobacteraceae bacterium]
MQHWSLRDLSVEPSQPLVIDSSRGEARSVVIHLRAGQALSDHQVHERAHVVVVDGEVDVSADGQSVNGGPG